MANESIKQEIKQAGLRLWQVADKLGCNDTTFSKKLRKEFSEDEKEKIRRIILELNSRAV